MAEEEAQKYEVLQKIGQGSFGIIRKVRRKTDNVVLCRKEISYGRMSDKEKNQLAAELDILKTLRHPNVVQYYSREHIKCSQDIHLYMEYCGNGDLGGHIKRLKDKNMWAEEDFVWTIFAQLVSALYRCHYGEDAPKVGQEGVVRQGKPFQTKQGHRVILHRDLKPENVFLGQNNAVKLGDFGLSKIIASHDFASTYVGTPFYMSPEICAAERYSHHSDVWSLGCILYELASRCVPFDARSHVELVMKIKGGRIKPLPEIYSRELWDVISWCLKVDPRSRPDTAQLLNVPQIKAARTKLEQAYALENAQIERSRLQQERDGYFAKLNTSLKQIQELQTELGRLREAGKKVEMEWHTKATLAIDQRVAEAEQKQNAELEKHKAMLQRQFEAAVDQQVEEKLKLHQASLPHNHGLGPTADVASHVRSSTPPPGKSHSSFATTATTGADSDGSSVAQDGLDATLETDISTLSIMEAEEGEDASPLAQRTKPPPKAGRRLPFGRAKTLANCNFDVNANNSPMDVHMADPSPVPNHIAPMSIKGLSLSPRRNGKDRLSGGTGLRKNIFNLAAEQKLRPSMAGDVDSGFADDDLLDDDDEFDALSDSPSRPNSGLSNPGDPFKTFAAAQQPRQQQQQMPPPKRIARPSLARQQTMPINFQQPPFHTRPRSNPFAPRANGASPDKVEKENRPPSSQAGSGRSGVPVLSAGSPKRAPKDGKVLTPSRKAPPPPSTGGLSRANTTANLAKIAYNHNNALASPGKAGGVRGRTLVELQQARLPQPDGTTDGGMGMDMGMGAAPKWLASPAKWDPMDEDMPSPFLAKKGRAVR